MSQKTIFARGMVHYACVICLGLGVLVISLLCFLGRKEFWCLRVLNSHCGILDASDRRHVVVGGGGGGGGGLGGRKMIM